MDLSDSAAGGVIVDLDWEWLLRCHFSDYESVVISPLGGMGSDISSEGSGVGWGCSGSLSWAAMLRYCYRRKGK